MTISMKMIPRSSGIIPRELRRFDELKQSNLPLHTSLNLILCSVQTTIFALLGILYLSGCEFEPGLDWGGWSPVEFALLDSYWTTGSCAQSRRGDRGRQPGELHGAPSATSLRGTVDQGLRGAVGKKTPGVGMTR